MNVSTSFLNDTKIETVNTKFATSILNELRSKLTLLQSAGNANTQKKDELDITSASSVTEKFTNDVANIINSFVTIIYDLKDHQNFADFSGASVAENETNFLVEYNVNKSKLQEQHLALNALEKDIANYQVPVSIVDENILKFALHNRFFKAWEKARRDQNQHFNRMQVDSVQKAVNDYANKVELEKQCMLKIETYCLNEMEMHKSESIRWAEKFDVDLNKTVMDIQMTTVALERMRLNYEKSVETIKRRVQEMIDFIALKEERALQKDSDMMNMIYRYKEHLFQRYPIFSELEICPT